MGVEKKTILVVEDDDSIRLGLIRAISEDGTYDVQSARNGIEAMAWLSKNERPDLILTDFLMVGNGAEVVALARRVKIPIIMLTAVPEEAERALNGLMLKIPVIAKPFDVFDVLGLVDTLTNNKPSTVSA